MSGHRMSYDSLLFFGTLFDPALRRNSIHLSAQANRSHTRGAYRMSADMTVVCKPALFNSLILTHNKGT
jgi:hypothetical protein